MIAYTSKNRLSHEKPYRQTIIAYRGNRINFQLSIIASMETVSNHHTQKCINNDIRVIKPTWGGQD